VILPGLAAISLFNFFFVGVTRDTQNFIIVAGHRARVKVRSKKVEVAEKLR
jgi:hypothetical protein